MVEVLPTAADAVKAPAPYVKVTLPIVSPFCNPVDPNVVAPDTGELWVVPYTLVPLFAVMVNGAAVTVKVPEFGVYVIL